MSEVAAIENVVRWLRNGCDPVAAATELDIIAKRLRGTERTADQPESAKAYAAATAAARCKHGILAPERMVLASAVIAKLAEIAELAAMELDKPTVQQTSQRTEGKP
jgi:hypothetical protein